MKIKRVLLITLVTASVLLGVYAVATFGHDVIDGRAEIPTDNPNVDADIHLPGEAQLTDGIDISTIVVPKKGDRFIAAHYRPTKDFEPDRGTLYLVDLYGSVKKLAEGTTTWAAIARNRIAVSPDGNSIAYAAREGNETFIGVMDVNSGETRRLLQKREGSQRVGMIIGWAEDNRLTYEQVNLSGTYLWQMSPDGSNLTQLTPDSISERASEESTLGFPSQDGRYIVYDFTQRPRSLGTGPSIGIGEQVPIVVTKTFRVEPVSGGDAYQLNGMPASLRFSSQTPVESSWSPDGNTLLIVRVQPSRALRLIAVDARNGGETTVVEDIWGLGTAPFAVDWSPDGRSLAFSAKADKDGHGGLYILDAKGLSEPERIGDGSKEYGYPQWLPDGSGILFFREGNLWVTVLDPGDSSREAAKERLKTLQAQPLPLVAEPTPVTIVGSTRYPVPFYGELNGFTFYDRSNYDYGPSYLLSSPKCVATSNGNNTRYAPEAEWKGTRLDFTATYLPPGTELIYAGAAACEDDVIVIQRGYRFADEFAVTRSTGEPNEFTITRFSGAPFVADFMERDYLEPKVIGGRPAIVYLGRSIIMRDDISKWSINSSRLSKEELAKVAEGLK